VRNKEKNERTHYILTEVKQLHRFPLQISTPR
jgi:hypothetical protein